MYNSLLHLHSGLRWVAFFLLLFAVFNSFSKWRFGKSYSTGDKLINLFTMIFFHVQLLVGFILYFISPKVSFGGSMMKDSMLRFFTIEHFLMMLIAIVLITIGRRRAEAATSDTAKHRKYLIWYGIALFLVIVAIPWPFRTALGAHWF